MNKVERDKIEKEWRIVQEQVRRSFNKVKLPDLNAILFLIGIQELNQIKSKFTKEEKQDLMHVAVCRILSIEGYFTLEGYDTEGWPHWKPLKKIPEMNTEEQEMFLKKNIITYFAEN